VTGTTSPQGIVGGDPHHHHTLSRLRDRETEGTGIRLSSTSANLTGNQQQRMLSPAVSAELFLLLSLFLDMCLMSLLFFPPPTMDNFVSCGSPSCRNWHDHRERLNAEIPQLKLSSSSNPTSASQASHSYQLEGGQRKGSSHFDLRTLFGLKYSVVVGSVNGEIEITQEMRSESRHFLW
jgi:hypothetical protein